MAHPEQERFLALVRKYVLGRGIPGKILEVGSFDVNGTIRRLFPDSTSYVGVDLIEGPGVDIVRSGHEVDLPENSFDLVLSCECFEHNPYWFETFLNMIRMTKPGGLVVVTCASRGRIEHGTVRSHSEVSPGTQARGWNYYKNICRSDFEGRMNLMHHFSLCRFYYIPSTADLYFFGFKRGGQRPESDLRLFELEVARIRLMERERLKYWWVVRRICNMPLVIASLLLDETRFQSFALPFTRQRRALGRIVGWKGDPRPARAIGQSCDTDAFRGCPRS